MDFRKRAMSVRAKVMSVYAMILSISKPRTGVFQAKPVALGSRNLLMQRDY